MNKIGLILIALLPLAFKAGAVSIESKSASQKNLEGYQLFKQGNFKEALDLFKQAAILDPTNAKYPYNAACALNQLWDRGRYPGGGEDVYSYLQRAVRLDPSRKIKMRSDPDLKSRMDSPRFLSLAGALPEEISFSIQKILQNGMWCSSGGEFEPGFEIEFKTTGTIELMTSPISSDRENEKTIAGTYRINNQTIEISLNEPIYKIWSFARRNEQAEEFRMELAGMLNKDATLNVDGEQAFSKNSCHRSSAE